MLQAFHNIMSQRMPPEGKNMTQPQIYEGTGEELQKHLQQHPRDRFRLILLPTISEQPGQGDGVGLRRGMFPQLLVLTEEDFKAAEWHGEDIDL